MIAPRNTAVSPWLDAGVVFVRVVVDATQDFDLMKLIRVQIIWEYIHSIDGRSFYCSMD